MQDFINILVLIMTLSFCVGCPITKYGLGDDDSCPASSISLTEEAPDCRQNADRLYFANEDNSKLKLEIRYIPMSEAKKCEPSCIIVNELINGPKVAG